MQWFETVPTGVQATVGAYLAAAAAHARAAEAARQAAVAARALAVQVPVAGEPLDGMAAASMGWPHAHPGTAGMTTAGMTTTGMGAAGITTTGMSTTGMGAPSMSTAGVATAGVSAPGVGATAIAPEGGGGGGGLGVAGGSPWPAALLDVLARRLRAGDLPLAALSEAELAAATGARPGEQLLVPLPHLDAQPAWAWQAAVAAGRDSLAHRRLLGADGEPGWALAALIALRTHPRAVTVAGPERQLPGPCHYLYGADGDAVLEEIVDAAGTHHFTLRSRGSACAYLARLADPYGRARESSAPLVADDTAQAAEWAAVHTAIARAEQVTQVSTTRPGPAAAQWLLLRLIAGPDGLLALACRHASGGGQAANARWLSSWALHRLLLACLDAAPAVAGATAQTC